MMVTIKSLKLEIDNLRKEATVNDELIAASRDLIDEMRTTIASRDDEVDLLLDSSESLRSGRGSWIIHDPDGVFARWCGASGNDWRDKVSEVTPFTSKADAEKAMGFFVSIYPHLRIVSVSQGKSLDQK